MVGFVHFSNFLIPSEKYYNLQSYWITLYQWNIALLLKHCSVARILLSVHHCIPFLHPSVQNAQNIQNVLESLFLR